MILDESSSCVTVYGTILYSYRLPSQCSSDNRRSSQDECTMMSMCVYMWQYSIEHLLATSQRTSWSSSGLFVIVDFIVVLVRFFSIDSMLVDLVSYTLDIWHVETTHTIYTGMFLVSISIDRFYISKNTNTPFPVIVVRICFLIFLLRCRHWISVIVNCNGHVVIDRRSRNTIRKSCAKETRRREQRA
jgi:hypothetical protein